MHLSLTRVGVQDFLVAPLHEGDYYLKDMAARSLVFERKTIKDFLASIPSRVGSQIKRCVSAYDRVILLLEGNWGISQDRHVTIGKSKQGWEAGPMWGKLYALQVTYPGLVVLTSPDQMGSARLIELFVRRATARGW